MAKYTPKAARERGERFETSWQANSPSKNWAEMSLVDLKAKRKAILDIEAEIAANEAKIKALMIERDTLNQSFMEDCDYIAAAVEGDRNYGSDSALYEGFGYIRESKKSAAAVGRKRRSLSLNNCEKGETKSRLFYVMNPSGRFNKKRAALLPHRSLTETVQNSSFQDNHSGEFELLHELHRLIMQRPYH